jgi:hypothetical protein
MSLRPMVQLEANLLRYCLRINGMTAFQVHDPWARALESPITPWLVEGQNHIAVSLAPVPSPPPSSSPGDEKPAFRIALHAPETEISPRPRSKSLLAEYQYSENESNVYGISFSTVFRHTFHVSTRFPWAYQKAAPYDANDKPAVEDVVRGLHAAMLNKNMAALKQLLAVRFTEEALGSEVPRDDVEGAFFESLGDMWVEDDWKVEPLSTLAIDTSAGGRLVHVGGMNGEPAITCRAGKLVLGVSPTLSSIEGKYAIVR